MAPDKIYVEIRHPMSIEYTEIIGFDTPEKNTIEYIRKDALMEWINEYKNYSSGPSWDLLKTHIETL